ncbi:hypothetical protein K501DRAFT_247387 [Backusella circina FSU 941]|nr:hypothetical protein K501DRAFT_247387 [Backusella circina FSU 941]
MSTIRIKKIPVLSILIALVFLFLTWIHLYSTARNTATPSSPPITPNSNKKYNEVDPASWPIQIYENDSSLYQPSLFSPHLFTEVEEEENAHYKPVTAIIHRVDKSPTGVEKVIQHLIKYPFIKEIYIYNANPKRPLHSKSYYKQFEMNHRVRIELIETGDVALESMGKFTACAVASYNKCYFQDDLWLNPYMDSLYTHASRYPEQLVANARPTNYMDYMMWRFNRPDIDLHTGYVELRYGAFVSRSKVQKFLSQLSRQDLSTSKLRQAENYFSIWTNQYPYLILNPLLSFGRERFKGVDTINNRELVQLNMFDAVSKLETSLMQTSQFAESDYFDRALLEPTNRDVKSSCSNDKCLFITNIDPLPLKQGLLFDSTVTSNMSQYEQLSNEYHLQLKSNYIHESFHKAVDQDRETCWNTIISPNQGDYFGLYMTGDIQASTLSIYLKKTSLYTDAMFKISVQHILYGSWNECQITSTSITAQRIQFHFSCPSKQPLKSIRVEFNQEQEEAFQLCGLALDNFIV